MNKQEIIDSLVKDIDTYVELISKRQEELKTCVDSDNLVDIAIDIRLFHAYLESYRNCLRRVKFLDDDNDEKVIN